MIGTPVLLVSAERDRKDRRGTRDPRNVYLPTNIGKSVNMRHALLPI